MCVWWCKKYDNWYEENSLVIRDILGGLKSIVSRAFKRYNECGSVMPTNKPSRLEKLNDQDWNCSKEFL